MPVEAIVVASSCDYPRPWQTRRQRWRAAKLLALHVHLESDTGAEYSQLPIVAWSPSARVAFTSIVRS